MKTHKYIKGAGYREMNCPVCLEVFKKKRKRWCCQHHVDRSRNSNKVVWCCDNETDVMRYPDSCHDWIHDNPNEAEGYGLYNRLDPTYKKKKSKKSWAIEKKKSPASKWKLKKTIGI